MGFRAQGSGTWTDKVQQQSLLQFSDSAGSPFAEEKVNQHGGGIANPFADWPGEDLNPSHLFSRFNLSYPDVFRVDEFP